MSAAGAEVILGTWVPALGIFEKSMSMGKFDESRKLPDGSLMEFSKVYPMDAVFDTPEDVPEETKTNKRYAGNEGYTVSEVAEKVKADFGTIDILVCIREPPNINIGQDASMCGTEDERALRFCCHHLGTLPCEWPRG